MIKNLLFDMGGVLVGFDKDRCVNAFVDMGAETIADYVEYFRTEDLFAEIEDGTIGREAFCEQARQLVGKPITDRQIEDAWNALLTPCTPAKKERLLELKKHYRLFLLSNTNIMHWEYCRDHLIGSPETPVTNYFEQCFLSFELHCVKPHADIFRKVLEQAGIKPEETLFIDDSALNLESARQLGFHVFLEQEGHHWAELLK